MTPVILTAVVAGVPLLVLFLELFAGEDISERHHSHHDTFVIASSLSRSLVIAMVFMGFTGVILGWLCEVGVFEVASSVVLGFFAGFLVVTLAIWVIMRRYKVALYEDYMIVTPFVGGSVTVCYADISGMEWTGLRAGSGYRDLSVFVGGEKTTTLWGGLDLEQILMRIDRFDVLARSSNS